MNENKKTITNFYLKIFIGLLLCLIFATISYNYFDQRIAILVSEFAKGSSSAHFFGWLSGYKNLINLAIKSDNYIYYLALILLAICFFVPRRLKFSAFFQGATLFSLAIVLAYAFKDALKVFFGRCCVGPAKAGVLFANHILVNNKAIGFNFFHGKVQSSLFPSGHMAITCALLSVLWIYFPRLKILWFLLGLVTALSLLLTNNHYLSDIISGAFLGIGLTCCCVRLFEE